MYKFLVCFILCLSFNANASFLIEPYAGLNLFSKWQADGESSTDGLSGSMIGGRAGVQRMGFMIGLDARMSTWEIDDSQSTKLNTTSYGFFVGYDFPIMLRLWGTYTFSGTGEVDDVGEFFGGSGFILGVGYKAFPFLSLNFESGTLNFEEFETQAGVNDEGREDAATYYLFSISFPITIGL